MDRKGLILHFLMFMFCACLPMTPTMDAAVNTLMPGFVAELDAKSPQADPSDLPLISSQSPRWDLKQIEAPEA